METCSVAPICSLASANEVNLPEVDMSEANVKRNRRDNHRVLSFEYRVWGFVVHLRRIGQQ